MSDPAGLQEKLRRYGIRPNRTYGQNFLLDDSVLDDMLSAAALGPGDAVLEIGPGLGQLTERLCRQAGFVLALEKDPAMAPPLRFLKDSCPNLHWEITDALAFDFQSRFRQQGFDCYKVVANIPYYVTGKILQLLLTAAFRPASITLLTQLEVASSAAALPGKMSLLSVSVQLYGRPRLVRTVPPTSFYPAPKVDSAILHVDLFKQPRWQVGDEKKFFSLVRACFAGRRKQIHNTLRHNFKLAPEECLSALSAVGVDPAARPQELSMEQWANLARQVQSVS